MTIDESDRSQAAAERVYRWRLAGFLAVAASLNFGDRAAISAVLASLRIEFGLSDVDLGLINSLFLASYALGSPFAGLLADRISRPRLVMWSILTWSGVTALTGLAGGLPVLLALRFALGITESLFLPAAVALIADFHASETRGRAMSLLTIGINFGLVIGGTFAGFMAQNLGWRAGFWMLGIGGLLLALSGRKFLIPAKGFHVAPPGVVAAKVTFLTAVKYLARVRTYHVLLLESMLSGFGMWVFFGWLPLYFREKYSVSLTVAGFAGAFILQLSVMLGNAAGGWISDRFAGRETHKRLLLYGVFYLLAAPFLLVFVGSPNPPVLALCMGMFACLRGVGQSNDNPTQCEIVPARFRASGVGIMNAVSTAAGSGGVLIAGYLKREIGLDTIFAGISGIFVIAGMALLLGYKFCIRPDIARAQLAG
ncbi:MAG: MFS transporter [Opitutaceae bacterium]|nr:MFS transporter [Opitutaceae bacterium]